MKCLDAKKILSTFEIIRLSGLMHIKQSMARSMYQFSVFVNPFMNTIFLYLMFRNGENDNLLSYVIISAGLMGVWNCSCFSTAGDINRERIMGTLPIVYTSPAGFNLVMFGKILANTIISLLSFAISLIVTVILSREIPDLSHLYEFVISFLAVIASVMMLGMMIGYIFLLSRKTQLYMNLIEIPFIFICGFCFPIEILPKWVQNISNLFAPTWAVRILRMSMGEINLGVFYHDLGICVFEIVILACLSRLFFLFAQKRISVTGTLEVC